MRNSETVGSSKESQGLVRGVITDYVAFMNHFENLMKAALSSQKDALLHTKLQGVHKPVDEFTGPTFRMPYIPTCRAEVDVEETEAWKSYRV